MRKLCSLLSLSLALTFVIVTAAPAQARDNCSLDCPTVHLKGVTPVTYNVSTEGFFPSDHAECDVDWKALNTAVEFVANQSTKLELLSLHQSWQLSKQLNHIGDDGSGHYSVTSPSSDAERQRSQAVTNSPNLDIFVTTVATGGPFCVAHVEMNVEAKTEPACQGRSIAQSVRYYRAISSAIDLEVARLETKGVPARDH
jgi:hypothetical protein